MGDFYERIFFGGRVAMKYKQLVRLKLSTPHGCRTCNLQNVPDCLAHGITQDQINAIDAWRSGPFDSAENAVLEFAEQMVLTNMEGEVTKPMYQALAAHFTEAEICELGTCMAVIARMAKLSFVLNLVEKETACPFGGRTAGNPQPSSDLR